MMSTQEPLKVLSLFDGISVARQAFADLKVEVDYYSSEIDPYCIRISENNWPDIYNCGDVRNISSRDFPFKIDILIGGSPCQGFSLQGLQKGLEDPRSALVTDFIRLKNELSPRYFILENTRMNKECKKFISEALGVLPIEINSLQFVPQSRNRLYWTNLPADIPNTKITWNLEFEDGYRPGVTRKGPPRVVKFTDYFGCLTASYYKGIRADGRPLLTKVEGEFDQVKDQIRMLTPEECERLQGLPIGYTEGVSNTQRYKALGNAFTLPVIKHLLSSNSTIL